MIFLKLELVGQAIRMCTASSDNITLFNSGMEGVILTPNQKFVRLLILIEMAFKAKHNGKKKEAFPSPLATWHRF